MNKWFFIFLSFVIVGLFYYSDTFAACEGTPTKVDLLVTSPVLTGNFYSRDNVCIVNVDAKEIAFDTFTIPNYDKLKSDYYDKAKDDDKKVILSGSPTVQNKKVYLASSNLTINSVSGSGVALIFVGGNLEIIADINYRSTEADSGLVFIVKNDVFIRDNVNTVNAVIISEGTIYTAASLGSSCARSSLDLPTLTINGSLISLNGDRPIIFCRVNPDPDTPSELINHEAKFLILLRRLMSDPFVKWFEI